MIIKDKRFYARHDCHLQGQFSFENQASLTLTIINLSQGGLGFEISQDQIQQLLNDSIEISLGSLIVLDRLDTDLTNFSLALKIRHLRRLSQQQYIAGAEFISVDADRQLQVEALIQRHIGNT